MISSKNVLKKALLTLIDQQIYVIFRLFRHNLTDNIVILVIRCMFLRFGSIFLDKQTRIKKS